MALWTNGLPHKHETDKSQIQRYSWTFTRVLTQVPWWKTIYFLWSVGISQAWHWLDLFYLLGKLFSASCLLDPLLSIVYFLRNRTKFKKHECYRDVTLWLVPLVVIITLIAWTVDAWAPTLTWFMTYTQFKESRSWPVVYTSSSKRIEYTFWSMAVTGRNSMVKCF